MNQVVVAGSFDDFRSPHVRFLDEASRLGEVHVLLWDDHMARAIEGRGPKFPQEERLYIVQAVRYVSGAAIVGGETGADALPLTAGRRPDAWVSDEAGDNPARRAFCRKHRLDFRVLTAKQLAGIPSSPPAGARDMAPSSRKKVVVTGCYDWFHSGHVRFFEEVSELGDLYVIVGHDANIRLLKGEGHPLFPDTERRYVVGAIRLVKQALISTGTGWMDAEPEIKRIGADIYAVNEDGDKPEKREFCRQHGLEYVVLKRTPKAGLPRRQSTDLRGF